MLERERMQFSGGLSRGQWMMIIDSVTSHRKEKNLGSRMRSRAWIT